MMTHSLLLVDFEKLFKIETAIPELIIKGSIMYLGILLLFRVLPQRTGGEMAMMDLIFGLLIAEAATHSLGGYSSVTEGFIVIVTMMAWNYLLNYLSYHIPFVEKMVSPPPLQIIKNGKLIKRNMRREYLTEEELTDHLRLEGIDKVDDVKAAYIEGDGHISVIAKRKKKT
jgi:uncharacterized membrane protein YcaP (DUF421 family)